MMKFRCFKKDFVRKFNMRKVNMMILMIMIGICLIVTSAIVLLSLNKKEEQISLHDPLLSAYISDSVVTFLSTSLGIMIELVEAAKPLELKKAPELYHTWDVTLPDPVAITETQPNIQPIFNIAPVFIDRNLNRIPIPQQAVSYSLIYDNIDAYAEQIEGLKVGAVLLHDAYGKAAYMNLQGKVVTTFQYQNFDPDPRHDFRRLQMYGDYATFYNGEAFGVLDIVTGQEMIPADFTTIYLHQHGVFAYTDQKVLFFDYHGQLVQDIGEMEYAPYAYGPADMFFKEQLHIDEENSRISKKRNIVGSMTDYSHGYYAYTMKESGVRALVDGEENIIYESTAEDQPWQEGLITESVAAFYNNHLLLLYVPGKLVETFWLKKDLRIEEKYYNDHAINITYENGIVTIAGKQSKRKAEIDLEGNYRLAQSDDEWVKIEEEERKKSPIETIDGKSYIVDEDGNRLQKLAGYPLIVPGYIIDNAHHFGKKTIYNDKGLKMKEVHDYQQRVIFKDWLVVYPTDDSVGVIKSDGKYYPITF